MALPYGVTYIHTYMHITYMSRLRLWPCHMVPHTYIHTYIHTCMHAYHSHIEAETMALPYGVTGTMSPYPVVVSVMMEK
jgi:hypothetical protein